MTPCQKMRGKCLTSTLLNFTYSNDLLGTYMDIRMLYWYDLYACYICWGSGVRSVATAIDCRASKLLLHRGRSLVVYGFYEQQIRTLVYHLQLTTLKNSTYIITKCSSDSSVGISIYHVLLGIWGKYFQRLGHLNPSGHRATVVLVDDGTVCCICIACFLLLLDHICGSTDVWTVQKYSKPNDGAFTANVYGLRGGLTVLIRFEALWLDTKRSGPLHMSHWSVCQCLPQLRIFLPGGHKNWAPLLGPRLLFICYERALFATCFRPIFLDDDWLQISLSLAVESSSWFASVSHFLNLAPPYPSTKTFQFRDFWVPSGDGAGLKTWRGRVSRRLRLPQLADIKTTTIQGN